MPRFYFRLIFIPFLFLTAVLLLIHAQPYDDSELRTSLFPDDCAAPCLMDITPGVTTVNEGIHILEEQAWVGELQKNIIPVGLSQSSISWNWSGQQPAWLDRRQISFFWGTNDLPELQDKIRYITLRTNVSFGRLFLLLGQPAKGFIVKSTGNHSLNYMGVFPDKQIVIAVITPCPIHNLWQTKANVVFTDKYYLSNQMSWADFMPNDLLRMCSTIRK